MISFTLEDVNDGPLREAAVRLGVPHVEGMTRADLIRGIKASVSPTKPLFLAPWSPGEDKKSWLSPPVLISFLSLAVAAAAATASWRGTLTALDKFQYQMEQETKESWQQAKVYDIIATNTYAIDKWSGISFDEIKREYTRAVQSERHVMLGKEDVQPDALHRLLKELARQGIVRRTVENKYVIDRTMRPTPDCAQNPGAERVKKEVVRILSAEEGKYTADQIVKKITDASGVPRQDALDVLNCMRTGGMILVADDDLVWTAMHPPTHAPLP